MDGTQARRRALLYRLTSTLTPIPVLDTVAKSPDHILQELERDTAPEVAEAFARVAAEYMAATRDGEGPVSTALSAAEIARRFDEPMPEVGRPPETILERVRRDILGDVNRLMHPMSLGHQVSAPLPAAVWMEPVIAAANQSIAVREMSPTATAVETQIIRWLRSLVGAMTPGAEFIVWSGDGGTFTSGGTEATFTALLAARAAAMPDAWEGGITGPLPVVVCGEHAHYAVTRAVAQLGLGIERAIAVPSRDWRMDVEALASVLDRLDREGTRVMAVVATAGSTATGSFDDLESIGAICHARGIWLHVDGAHGMSALFSPRHRHRLAGVYRARTIAWDPHKMMLMPLSAGVLLARNERYLEGAFAQRAPYLFHGDETERVLDQGIRSFQCSRRADALKLWVALQRYGADGIGGIYDHLCAMTRALWEAIAERDDVAALHEPECNILCFRWTGGRDPNDPALDPINKSLRERYNASGRGWITTTVLGGRRVLRVTIMNPRTREMHLRALLDGLAEEARAIA